MAVIILLYFINFVINCVWNEGSRRLAEAGGQYVEAGSVLSFLNVGSEFSSWVTRVGGEHVHPLSHLFILLLKVFLCLFYVH